MALNSVVLPAPFGPITANTVFSGTAKLIASLASEAAEALGDVLDREEHQPPSGFAASRRRHSMPGSAASPLGKKIRIRISTDA